MEERELRRAIQDKKMNFISERDATSSYRKEQKLLNLLAAGRADEVDLREEFHFLPENIYDDAVMTYKGDVKQTEYLMVAVITLSCRAVISGGVDPFEAYRISDIYLQQLSECSAQHDMLWVVGEAMKEFNALSAAAHPAADRASQDLENAKTYICRHLKEKLSMKDVCHAVGISPGNLSEKFRKSGTTFRKYVLEERLKSAANMLAQTQEPVSVISDYLGFSSPSYFGNCFLKRYNMTPLEYRKRHKFHCN